MVAEGFHDAVIKAFSVIGNNIKLTLDCEDCLSRPNLKTRQVNVIFKTSKMLSKNLENQEIIGMFYDRQEFRYENGKILSEITFHNRGKVMKEVILKILSDDLGTSYSLSSEIKVLSGYTGAISVVSDCPFFDVLF